MIIPSEFTIGGVYVSPLFIASILGTIAAIVTARILNRVRLSRYFFYPPLVFVALTFIFNHGEFICASVPLALTLHFHSCDP